jgi:hypothetical protein
MLLEFLKVVLVIPLLFSQGSNNLSYLTWSKKQAVEVGKSMRATGRVSGTGRGIFNTEKSSSYRIRATWITPEVIRATVRLHQMQNRLSDEETKALVSRAERTAGIFFMLEIDPDEGSGVIPSDWQAFLQPRRAGLGNNDTVAGIDTPVLRKDVAFTGVFARDYNYDVYWVVFPQCTRGDKPLFTDTDKEIELIIRIEKKEGKFRFPIPESLRRKVECERFGSVPRGKGLTRRSTGGREANFLSFHECSVRGPWSTVPLGASLLLRGV